ncbi:MAG: helix-turn-helix domain-containing protein [Bacilli bacterium]
MKFSDNLKKLRKDMNLSQEDLADKLGVSRQSISKWESGVVYPEMDKMVQLCKIFNLSMDDLLNNDVVEVKNTKEAKSSINKFIDSFFKYVNKTIKMFSSMSFKEKFKCLFEQFLIVFCLIVVFLIIGLIGDIVVTNLFSFLSYTAHRIVFHIFESIYVIAYLVLAIILVLYIFKIRYLDYYVIEESEKKVVKNGENNEKVIIRDPRHSEYRFINYIAKVFVICVKLFVSMFGVMFCFSLVFFALCLVLSFLIVKSGLLFLGVIIGLVSLVVMNYVVLNFIYDFVFNHKSKKSLLAVMFVGSLFVLGCGIGLSLIGVSNFEIISADSAYSDIRTEYIDMNDDITFTGYNFVFKESDDNNIKITYKNTKNCEVIKSVSENVYSFYYDYDYEFNFIKKIIRDVNDRKIYMDYDCMIEVSSNKSNIDKLEKNYSGFYHYYR